MYEFVEIEMQCSDCCKFYEILIKFLVVLDFNLIAFRECVFKSKSLEFEEVLRICCNCKPKTFSKLLIHEQFHHNHIVRTPMNAKI